MDGKIAIGALNLSDDDAKFIEISREGVCLRVPLEHSVSFAIGQRGGTSAGPDANAHFQRMMTEFWDEEAGKGGVSLKARLNDLREAEFFKEATTEEDVIDAVRSLVRLKKRFCVA